MAAPHDPPWARSGEVLHPPIIGLYAKTRIVQVDAFFLSRHKGKIWT